MSFLIILKLIKICQHAVKKLTFLTGYIPNEYKTKQICDLAILENSGTLKSVSAC